MSQSTLPLSNVVDVTVQISPQAVAPPSFNKYLIVGTSTHIPTAIRTVAFSGGTSILQQMLSYGFVDTDPEYKAAAQYLAASSNPYFLTIGRQDLTASETCLQAVEACRIVDPTWYLFTALAADDTANIALSEWAQTASPVSQIFWSTSSADTLTGVGDIFTTLKAGNYNRYQGVYATTQSGAAPNNAYIASALAGLAMGLNTGFNNSYFTLTNKVLVGMTPEPITQAQFDILSGNNGNVYASYGGSFDSYSTGITGSGQYFDQILGIDMLVADIQFAGANVLAQYAAIGQNDPGQSLLIHAMNVSGCQPSADRGFISGGVWNGKTIQFGKTIALQAGTAIPDGYLNISPSYSQIAKPAKRASAPIYSAIIQTDAVQQIIVAVMVQQ